jgi:hypothetical protein
VLANTVHAETVSTQSNLEGTKVVVAHEVNKRRRNCKSAQIGSSGAVR